MNTYVVPTLTNYLSTTCTFDLWMSKGTHDIFVVVNFISSDKEIKHVMIEFFEVMNTNGVVMAPKF